MLRLLFKVIQPGRVVLFILNVKPFEKLWELIRGITTTNEGDNLLVNINKSIRLPSAYVPGDLVSIHSQVPTIKKGLRLRKEAADSLLSMVEEAKKERVKLAVTSSYRSYLDQKEVFNKFAEHFGLRRSLMFSARPGYSQHQLGTTVDFISNTISQGLSTNFDETKEGKWLLKNAHKFGFVLSYPLGKEQITGYSYEPWHYRYIGNANANKMRRLKLTLEEFLITEGS